VADGNAALTLGNPHLGPGDDRAGEGGSEQITVFPDSIALDSAPAELLDEFTLQVLDDKLGGTDLEGLLLGGFEVLVLPDVGLQ